MILLRWIEYRTHILDCRLSGLLRRLIPKRTRGITISILPSSLTKASWQRVRSRLKLSNSTTGLMVRVKIINEVRTMS
jgi:hypothetical protein